MSGFGYNVLGFGANASSAAGGASDDQFNRVSFLSHFDGANNGVNNAFDDGSTSNHTITANGNVTQGSFGPFARPDGNWGWNFDGDGDYLTVADSTEFDFGTGNFTIEGWINPAGAGFQAIFSIGPPVQIYSYNNSIIAYFNDEDNTSSYTINGLTGPSSSVSANTWTHFAVVRNGNTYTAYVNGVAGSSLTSSDTVASSSNAPAIGTYLPAPTTYEFNGHISNLRLVKGTAVYTSNFTPSTSKLTAITNTKLLTCQSNRFIDNSASGHTLTPTGNTAVTAFGPFLTSSVYDAAVNGASSIGGYVAAATSTDWQFGSGNFTVEFWTYPLGTGSWVIAHGVGDVTGSAISWQYGYGTFDFYYGSSSVSITSPTLTLNSWQYITVVRNGATITAYKDGVSTGTANIGSNSLNTGGTSPFYVGAYPDAASSNINGYLSDVRVVKGTAVYTGNFTPPTAPLTAVTNTKLLLSMKDGQAIDSAAQTNLTLYGNANTSTDQAKFGTASLHLDGTGDYVNVLPSGRGNIYNYTVEQWLYPTRNYSGSGNFDRIWASGTALNNSVMLHLDNTTAPKIVLRSNDSIIWTSSVSISLNAWTHVAVSCDANGTRLYIDGTERATTSTIVNLRNLAFNIGTSTTSAGFFQGYVDDFRTSDFARYTSNFTAPTEPFADKGQ